MSLIDDLVKSGMAKVTPKPARRTYVDQIVEARKPFSEMIAYCDFEYNDHEVVSGHFTICVGDTESAGLAFWFSKHSPVEGDHERFHALIDALKAENAVFCGHAVGIAEMVAMLRLGVDLRGTQWVDTFTEAKMIGAGHPYARFFSYKLLDVASKLGIKVSDDASEHKTQMRDLIISGGPFSVEDRTAIMDYCAEDTRLLPEILTRLRAIHTLSKVPDAIELMLRRGAYLLATTLLNWRTRGLPVDVEFWSDIDRYRVQIRDMIARNCNAYYEGKGGWAFYAPKKKRSQTEYTLKRAKVVEWARDNGIDWALTASGQPRLDFDYFDQQVRRYPELLQLKKDKDALQALSSVRLDVTEDGYVSCGSRTYHTITGRNQPMVKEGFVFNMSPVFRVAGTKPKAGMAMIAADWSKQEPAIAIGLSGDEKYRALYDEKDLYLSCAIRAGAAPEGATKESHKVVRDAFKAAMLGIGYGMGWETLSRKIYTEVNSAVSNGAVEGEVLEELMTLEEAQEKAGEILEWHKSTFSVMWDYLNQRAEQGRDVGWIHAEDGWIGFVNEYTKHTQLINFPIQANGAAMLREAVITIAEETDLDVPFTLHDAIYVNCEIEDIEATKAILKDHMERAANSILRDNPVPIMIDFKVITEDQPLADERAATMLPILKTAIEKFKTFDSGFI